MISVKKMMPLVSGEHHLSHALKELVEIFGARTIGELYEEICDFIGCLSLWIGWRWLPVPSYFFRKIERRLEVWNGIFREHGLIFKNKYLVNGSNYMKTDKVDMALDLALREQRRK